MVESINQTNIYKKIWEISKKLHGAVEGWFFTHCLIGAVFYKFISESFIDSQGKIFGDFSYAERSDDAVLPLIKEATIRSKGFFLYPSQLFVNVVKNIDKYSDIAVTLDTIFKAFEDSAIGYPSEEAVKGLLSVFDVRSDQLGATVEEKNKNLKIILNGIASLDIHSLKENKFDLFGDVYEFVKTNHTTAFIKSGGEYFTPPSLAQLTARLALYGLKDVNAIHDPTCGSGSILVQAKKIVDGIEGIKGGGVFVGQEVNLTTHKLARMNMFLHDVPFNQFYIALGDTLINPKFATNEAPLKPPFDAVVSNPPFSTRWIGKDCPEIAADKRFACAGDIPPKGKADFAFILHSLYHLSENGRAAIICATGVLHRPAAEYKIRQYLVNNNYVDSVIALPTRLFENTAIAVNILLLRKNKNNSEIKFIRADSFCDKVNKKSIIQQEHVEKILELYSSKEDELFFTRTVPAADVQNNNYSLRVSDYVQKEVKHDFIDIDALEAEIIEASIKTTKTLAKIDELVRGLKKNGS